MSERKPGPKPRSTYIQLRVTPEEKAKIAARAARMGVSMSNYLRIKAVA